MKMGPNKAFEDIGTKACLILNADVGSEYNELLRVQWTFPYPRQKEHRPCGHDFGVRSQEQPMKKGSNKALQVTAHKAAPNLNADVR